MKAVAKTGLVTALSAALVSSCVAPELPRDVARVTVREHHDVPGYDRDQFGPRWSDDVEVSGGHNGCDTRNDVLRRDLERTVLKHGTRGCVVLSGVLYDPYTGVTVDFSRERSDLVPVDHIVSLSAAWDSGAADWSVRRRRDFANDPRNLQATTVRANTAKGDLTPSRWLPPAREFRCQYAQRYVDVVQTYGLTVTRADQQVLARELRSCPSRSSS